MNFIKNTVMGLGSAFTSGGVGSLPFTLVDAAGEDNAELPDFQLLKAKSKQDGARVSVFKSLAPPGPLTQNALRRIKTLRHPNVLSYIDGTEVANGNVFIVTEEVVPLTSYLEEIRSRNGSRSEEETLAVSWGLRAVLSALKFINMDCKMVHGRLNPESIFVTKGGDWKLAGFQLTGELTMDGPFISHSRLNGAGSDSTRRFTATELSRGDWNSISSGPVHALDMYGFACTAASIFNPSFSTPNDMQNIPPSLSSALKRACDPTPTRRITPDQALQAGFFDSPFIRQMSFVEQLAIKSSEGKTAFYKDLVANVDKIPRNIALFKVLPALKAVVDFGVATGTGGKTATYKLDPCESQMLPAMVKIGSHLPGEEFKVQVLPTLVKLFGCNDRAVRVQLLQMMDLFAVHFDSKLVNSPVVFDNICTGFNDTMPLLRELTMKSMLHIADKLSDSNLNQKLMKYFAKLQVDSEPAIRTNTTICLGKMAEYMNVATRGKVLLPAFCRALKDPFPHARLAGLRTLMACDEYFTPQDISNTIIPSISPLMLDISRSVRDEAIGSMTEYMKKIQEESKQMGLKEDEEERERALNAPIAPPSVPSKTSEMPSGHEQSSFGSTSAPFSTSSEVKSFNDVPDDDFGNDAWGDDDLDGLASPPSNQQPASLSSYSSTFEQSATKSIGSLNLSMKALAPAPAEGSFFDDWGTSAPSSRTGSGTKLGDSLRSTSSAVQDSLRPNSIVQDSFSSVEPVKPRKTIQERKLEAKAKKEPLGAMKLASKPKGGDNWDWDM
ncbi:hypothetical protein AC1031_015478 [Aphanomyces cochlioides]|nr:hypothetical protein AC1031_015478 [Aphanomyces cochlioides]